MLHNWRFIGLVLSCLTARLFAAGLVTPAHADDEAGIKFFESKVRPIMVEHCYECHGPESDKGEANLRVDSLDSLRRGGDSGPAIIPGDPNGSLLILAVRQDGAVSMPPKTRLAQAEINALAAWIKMGAPWPSTTGAAAPVPARSGSATEAWDQASRRVLGVSAR